MASSDRVARTSASAPCSGGAARGHGRVASFAALAALAWGGCSPAGSRSPSPSSSPSTSSSSSSSPSGSAGPSAAAEAEGRSASSAVASLPLAGDYRVTWLPADGSLQIEGTFIAIEGGRFIMEREIAPYVREVQAAPGRDGVARWSPIEPGRARFGVAACAAAPCRLRYRVLLRAAATAFESLDWAGLAGDLVEAPPSTWLVVPDLDVTPKASWKVRFRVSTPPGSSFATGVFRARDEAPGPATPTPGLDPVRPDHEPAWEIDLRDLWTSPYSAFGPMTLHSIPLPQGGSVTLAIAQAETLTPRDQLVGWVQAAVGAVGGYWGRFPMPGALVLLAVSPGSRVGGGHTLSGGGGTVMVDIGARATLARLQADWVLVHELVHLGFPSVPRQHTWAQEGIATYVEPFARVRGGLLDERAAWKGLWEGLPNGLPRGDDGGLDHTPTWGRTYWGGALFWFLADVEIRKRSGNRLGLEHALRGILEAGANNAARWPLREVLAAGDRAVGLQVLVPQYDAMKAAAYPVELAPIMKQLGVIIAGDQVSFDDRAPLAAIRRAIAHGTAAP
jgi:hypothetical protein